MAWGLTTYELARWVVNTYNEVWHRTGAVRWEYYGSEDSLSNKKGITGARR